MRGSQAIEEQMQALQDLVHSPLPFPSSSTLSRRRLPENAIIDP